MALKQKKATRQPDGVKLLSSEARFFLEPQNPRQRQYEALRAYFAENLPAKDVAARFGYTAGAFYVLCHQFRRDMERNFFIETRRGPKFAHKRNRSKETVIALRKQNYSVQDIHRLLTEQGISLGQSAIWTILNEEGFSRLPRRRDEERPDWPKPAQAAIANIRQLDLSKRVIEMRVGGVFLLLRILANMGIHRIPTSLNWYGSKMIPPVNAFFSSLLLKLVGKKRKSHVMDYVFDEGAALATGLNVLPKTAYIAEYSERITHEDNLQFLHKWVNKLRKSNVITGESFNLDFQSLPYFGKDDVVQKHYVSMRSRSQKAILVFFAQDAKSKIFCYSNADLRKGEESEEIFRFVDFWKKQTGKKPPHLVFDSTLTTIENLSRLNEMRITFVTLRRRTPSVMRDFFNVAPSAWRKVELERVERKFRFPKVFDQTVHIQGYAKPIRQIYVKDLGHEKPTVIITNDNTTSCPKLIGRYARRMLIENEIANGVGFFHTTALSSSVAIKIDFDVLMTLIGQATYHILAQKLRGYESCGAETIFRKFVDTPAKIFIGKHEIEVRLNKRATNPILMQSGLVNTTFRIPWVQNRKFIITLR